MSHAIEPLKLKIMGIIFLGIIINRGNSLGIMGGKLWIKILLFIEQFFNTMLITQLGIVFLCKNGEFSQTFLLSIFYFIIPISTFYQPDGDDLLIIFCQSQQVINHCRSPFLISLNRYAQLIPSFQFNLSKQHL